MSVWSDAIKVIEERGWTQGDYGYYGPLVVDAGAPVCLVGAIAAATGEYVGDVEQGICKTIPSAYLALPHTSNTSLTIWNDHPSITKEDVIALLRKLHDDECAQVNPTAD